MHLKEMETAVERSINKLITTFYNNPAIFLTEADVQSYLYHLLISDPDFAEELPLCEDDCLRKKSGTLLIHSELQLDNESRTNKKADVSIIKARKKVYSSELEGAIGIEIKYNRRIPAGKEPSGILKDVKKVSQYYSRGYVLWLNWDRSIDDEHLKKVKKLVDKRDTVQFYYLDLFSDPIKTNLEEIFTKSKAS